MVIMDTAMARERLRLDTITDTMDTPMVDMVMVMARGRLSQVITMDTLMVDMDMVMDMARGRLSQDITMDTLMVDMDMVMDTMVKQQLFICSKISVNRNGHQDHFE